MRTLIHLFVAVGLLFLLTASCDKVNSMVKIPAKFAGQVIDANGHGQGYMSIELVNSATGTSDYKQNVEDNGGFFIDGVMPGKYTVKVLMVGGKEVPNDAGEINISPGKTINKMITITREQNGVESAGGD